MKRLASRVIAMVAVVGIGALAIVQAQRSSAPASTDREVKGKPAITAPAPAANVPPTLASTVPPAPLPTTVDRANEIPAADQSLGNTNRPGKVVLAAAEEPVAAPANGSAGPVDLFSRPLPPPPTSGPTLAPPSSAAAKPAGILTEPAGGAVNPPCSGAERSEPDSQRGRFARSEAALKPACLMLPKAQRESDQPAHHVACPCDTSALTVRTRLSHAPCGSTRWLRRRLCRHPLAARRKALPRTTACPQRASPAPCRARRIDWPGRFRSAGQEEPRRAAGAADHDPKVRAEGVQVGKPALFKVAVINTGQVAAQGVEIRDQIPKGTQLIGTKPKASRGASGELVWELGILKPGDETSVEMQLMPVAEGEIGSVASVRFNADVSARTVATKPELVVKCASPTRS